MSRTYTTRSLVAGLLLLVTACGAPSLSSLPGAELQSFAKRTPTRYKYAMGVTRGKEDLTIAGDGGMRTLAATLPPVADLRPNMPPVANQVAFGSCTSFAFIKGLREYMARKEGRPAELSTRFFWYASRKFVDQKLHTTGAESYVARNTGLPGMAFGAQALKLFGTVKEQGFPYPTLADFGKLQNLKPDEQNATLDQWAAVAPPKEAWDAAKSWRVDETLYAVDSVHGMRKALSEGKPVAFAAMLFESFMGEDAAKTGRIPLPNLKTDKPVGGHAMCAVGYDNAKRVFIVRNSWSTGWGDQGYCYIPYDYFNVKNADGDGLCFGGYSYR